MSSLFRLIRGKKDLLVEPFSSAVDTVWRVVKDGSSFRSGDLVSAKRPMPLADAIRRVASWRTKVSPYELSLIRPVEGRLGREGDLVPPYDGLLRLVESEAFRPDPRPAA